MYITAARRAAADWVGPAVTARNEQSRPDGVRQAGSGIAAGA
ncbi:hypothetical protein [Mycolicibacterium houstonense]|nr:hypothetical protein [Mycolicibacterium houstonense]